MKKIVTGKELQEKMEEAVNLLCDTVKTTLGPKGSNIIIDHSNFSPFITNDGVTIAENIESDDEVLNTILGLAKEASIKTNTNVGDGTTTTLVLLQKIYNLGLELIRKGENPIVLKRELDQELAKIIPLIKKESHIPNEKDLKNIAIISSNDEEIGTMITDAYLKVGDIEAINIQEGEKEATEERYIKGYSLETNLASDYFLSTSQEIKYLNPLFLLANTSVDDLEDLALILNNVLKEQKSLVIMATGYSEEFIQNILTMNSDYQTNIMLLKTPYYGLNSLETLEDIAALSGSRIIDDVKNIKISDLGQSESITINRETTIINYAFSPRLTKYLEKLAKEDKDNKKRIVMLEKGSVEIMVGAPTTTERREKKMRFDDALYALNSATSGVLLGSGVVLSKISETLDNKKASESIFKESLLEPLKQILVNSGNDYHLIYEELKKANFKNIYNVKTGKMESEEETVVLDSLEVILNSLKNATSIAGMLLTTTSLIINEYPNNPHVNSDYY